MPTRAWRFLAKTAEQGQDGAPILVRCIVRSRSFRTLPAFILSAVVLVGCTMAAPEAERTRTDQPPTPFRVA